MIFHETMQYRMVFCDIDGTLLDSAHHISQRTKQKIQELYHDGIPFILVSARMPLGIFPLQQELAIKAPIVCYSGALILDEEGAPMRSVGIDRETVMRIHSFIQRGWSPVCSSFYSSDDWLTDNIRNKWILQEQYITASQPIERQFPDLIPQKGHIHKLLCMGEAEMIADLNSALKEAFSGITVYRSKDTYLEIMNGAVSKSSAVKHLCKIYKIPIETTVSFGDNDNDADMLMATGTSFAMGNAPEAVKRLAKNITSDNDHEGVAQGLKQLNFIKNRI